MAPRRTTRLTADQETINATSVTNAQLQAMIDQGVTAALAVHDALRSTNGDDSHNSRTGVRRTERANRECTYTDFFKCQPLPFKGTEGVAIKFATCTLYSVALTWWNTHVQTVGHEAAYGMTRKTLMKMMTKKYSPRNKIRKLEMELWDLKRGTGLGQRPACYECGVQGHFKRECPKLKNNNNHGNQGGRNNAPARVHAVGRAGTDPDANVVI
nr:hypothetical protein [Tanacetum cinerariifolium]